jgi:hypothetical protein
MANLVEAARESIGRYATRIYDVYEDAALSDEGKPDER